MQVKYSAYSENNLTSIKDANRSWVGFSGA